MGMRARRLAGALLAAGLLTGVAAGCTAGESGVATHDDTASREAKGQETKAQESGGTAERQGSQPGDSGAAPDAVPGTAGKPGAPQPEQAVPPQLVSLQNRQLARKASLSVTAPEVVPAADRARSIAAAAGGYTGTERISHTTASLDVIVPADRLDATLVQLSQLGEVSSREQTVEDVTEQVVDVDSRVASQRASVERVRGMLDGATSISELASVERELTSRESELESLLARKNALAGQVGTSTVSLSVRTPQSPPEEPEDEGILGGFADGWSAFVNFGGGVLRAVAAVSPFVALIGVPAFVLVWWWRRRRTAMPATAVGTGAGTGASGD